MSGDPTAAPGAGGTLEGARIGVTSHRRGVELAATLSRRGASVVHGATLTGDRPAPDAEILADTRSVLAETPRWIVATTGVGMRLWAEAADRGGLGGALCDLAAGTRCVARSAKAVGGLSVLGVEADWVSPSNTDRDVVSWLRQRVLPGDVVAVQLHGGPSTAYDALGDTGADLLTVLPYGWTLPDERGPAQELVGALVDGELDLLTFTSAGAVHNLVTLATELGDEAAAGVRRALAGGVAVAAVGPVTAEAVELEGGVNTVVPRRWRTADLVRGIEAWWARREDVATDLGLRLVPDRHTVLTAGGEIELGDREYAVLASLSRRPGVLVRSDELLVEAWGHQAPDDAGVVKHQISRLRRKLDGCGVHIETVRGLGYRMEVDP